MPRMSVMPSSVRSVLTCSDNMETYSDIRESLAQCKLENKNAPLHPLPDLLNIKTEQDPESMLKPIASGNKGDPHFDGTEPERNMGREEVDSYGVVPDIVGPLSDITNRLHLHQSPCKVSITPRKPSTPVSSVFSCYTPGRGICGDTSATDVRQ